MNRKYHFNYKGYIAEVRWDEEDLVYIGKVVNTETQIAFHNIDLKQIEETFHEAVDNYYEACKELNITPEHELKYFGQSD